MTARGATKLNDMSLNYCISQHVYVLLHYFFNVGLLCLYFLLCNVLKPDRHLSMSPHLSVN